MDGGLEQPQIDEIEYLKLTDELKREMPDLLTDIKNPLDGFKKDEYDWYTKEAFENELKKQCSIVEILNSTPEETRTLYLCNKQAI